MPLLSLFTSTSLPAQSTDKAYGVKNSDLFRVSSSFEIASETTAYAMIEGTLLLQQQATDPNKVNLILRPHNQKDLKLPVKYIIYRGLKTTDFVDSTNLSDTANKVKTSGNELLAKMQTIQMQRSPGTDIPIQALFGNELTPSNSKNIDEFFFKNLASSSQLFTVDCGIELGKYAVGEIGVEIILDNPEYFVTVDIAKKSKYEIDVSGITDATQKKWQKDLVRHFVDPSAFYGLHYDIKGGIEYRQGANKLVANTSVLVYQNVIDKFLTKNKVYLDVRNENGYSYNYYGNYVGTGVDANKNIKIGQTAVTLVAKEYYTNGWAIHTIDVMAGSASENEIFVALRVDDNERPLIAGWNYTIVNVSGTGTIVPDENVYFADEIVLLGSPIPNPLPDFTNAVSFKVPNVLGSTPNQLSTIVKFDYVKQIQLVDPNVGIFPYFDRMDYLFGPISTKIPWDSGDGVQWIDSYHYKFVDGFNQGFITGSEEFDIESIDPALKKIVVNQIIDQQISNKIRIRNVSTYWQNVGEYNVIKVEVIGTNTEITVLENIQTKYNGDKIVIDIEVPVTIESGNTGLIAKDIDLTGIPAFQIGKKVKLYTVFSQNVTNLRTITNIHLSSGWTYLILNSPIESLGFGAIMESGMVSETDVSTTPPDNDNILFYAVPFRYYKEYGITTNNLINKKGGTNGKDTFIEMIQKQSNSFEIQKYSLQPTTGNFIATLSYKDNKKAKEIILLLGLKKSEFEDLKTAAASQLSPYHIQMLKLIPQGNRLRDEDYEPYYKYHLVVTGLDNAGNYAETTIFKEIYSRDGLIFTSPQYARTGASQSAIGLDEALDELLDINNQSLSRLSNTTNEELKQLSTLWNSISNARSNKELYLLDGSTLSNGQYTLTGILNTLPLELRNELDVLYSNYPNTAVPVNEIENLLLQKGTELITLARQRIREANQLYSNKDGIPYLVRLMMQLVLKNHKTVVNSASGYLHFSGIFERASRGWEGSAKPNFSGYPSNYKKVLISGFDPYGSGFDGEGYNSNPSGNIALALDGKPIMNGNVQIGIIRTTIFPVRYDEFNAGWVEKFFKPFLSQVDMIITFSYGIDTHDFQIDRFASDFRYGGLTDNNNLKDSDINLDLGDTFIENKLPYDKLDVGGNLAIPINTCSIGINHRAYWEIFADMINPITRNVNVTNLHSQGHQFINFTNSNYPQYSFWDDRIIIPILKITGTFNDTDFGGNSQVSEELKYVNSSDNINYIKSPSWNSYPDNQPWINNYQNFKIKARIGSGQFYFSNEIHYRVANLRKTFIPELKTGHIHVGFLQGDPVTNREEMLQAVEYIIKKMTEGL